jgi:chromosome segregation ATPase
MSEDTTRQLPDDGVRLILARFDSMDARLTALEDKVDRRLQETRPIWEQVLIRLTAIEERLTNVEERLTNVERELVGVKEQLANVETRLGKVEEEVYGLNRKVRIFSVDITKLQDKDDDLEERLKQIEAEHTR